MPDLPSSRCPRCGTVRRSGDSCKVCFERLDRQRGSAHSRGYSRRWREAREAYLRARCDHDGAAPPADCPDCAGTGLKHRWCRLCKVEGRGLAMATDVDHIKPHGGNPAQFWNRSNWQPLCGACHRKKTNAERRPAKAPAPAPALASTIQEVIAE